MQFVYDNSAPLKCFENPELHRRVGVYADEPINHTGMGCQMVECLMEKPTLNTITCGSYHSLAEVDKELARMTRLTIEQIDKIVAELQGHRARLQAELDKGIHFDAALAAQIQEKTI